MIVGQVSHRGNIRTNNEDKVYSSQAKDLLIIADGMGGHNAGEIASKNAVNKIKYYIKNRSYKYKESDSEILKLLYDAIHYANKYVFNLSNKDNGLIGMGTTLTTAYITNDTVYVGHVGDSRLYVVNKKGINQITKDHTLVQELFENGTITEEEMLNYPNKNIITRALGCSEKVEIDTYSIKLKKNDVLLLCTDGISNVLSDEEIHKIVLEYDSPQKCARKLVDMANNNGGTDNVSVIIAKNID